MNRKAYFFLLDSLFALTILVIGFVLIFSWTKYEPSTGQTKAVSKSVLDMLSENQIKDINNYYSGPNGVLARNGNITDIDKTIVEQVGEFYYRSTIGCGTCIAETGNFLQEITKNLLPAQYNIMVLIENVTVYSKYNIPINESRYVSPSKIIVHGMYNEKVLFGPYILEVLSWE